MKPGTYNPDDADGEFGIQNMPDSWVSIDRNWIDTEYQEYPIQVEVVKYLDGSVRVNAIKFIHSKDEINFIESVDTDQTMYESSIDDKFDKMLKVLESQLC